MTELSDLLRLMGDRALTPAERHRLLKGRKKSLHAAPPGTGPAGETCGSCAHYVRRRMGGIYRKCGLCRSQWTNGPGTDIRAKDAACSKWEKPSDVA